MAVDWAQAHEQWHNAVHEHGDKNPFIETVKPLAHVLSLHKAMRYAGGRLATHMDYDACYSAALGALLEVCSKAVNMEETSPEWLHRRCAVAVGRRLTDLERSVLGRHSPSINRRITSYDVKETTESREVTRIANMPEAEHPTQSRLDEALEEILKRTKRILTQSEQEALGMYLSMQPQGYTIADVAAMIGKAENLTSRYIVQARAKIRENMPELAETLIHEQRTTEGAIIRRG